MKAMTVIPLATEKAYRMITDNNEYLFRVPLSANKDQIAQAIKEQYDVTPVSVRVAVQTGKAIRYNRGKGRYPGTTHRNDTKKAYVTLKEGDSIQVFTEADAPAEEAKQ